MRGDRRKIELTINTAVAGTCRNDGLLTKGLGVVVESTRDRGDRCKRRVRGVRRTLRVRQAVQERLQGVNLLGGSDRSGLGPDLGWEALSGAADHLAVLDEALDEPMTLTRAELAGVDTTLAKIVVTTVTDAAVVMLVVHNGVALVAVHGPGRTRYREALNLRLGAEGQLLAQDCEHVSVVEAFPGEDNKPGFGMLNGRGTGASLIRPARKSLSFC